MEKTNEFEELTECPICTEIFVQPKVLPCIHTFCLKCLISYSRDKEPRYVLPCPVCRKEFLIPASGIVALPNNYFIQKLLEIKDLSSEKALSSGSKCDICNESEETNHYCFDCRQRICEQCLNYHEKMRFNKGHKIINSSKVGNPDKIMQMTSSFCQIHLEEPVKYYCVDCSIVICVSCYVEEHSTHKCASISKEAETARVQLFNDIKDVKGKFLMLRKLSDELKSYETDLQEQVAKNMSKVAECHTLKKQICNNECISFKDEIEVLRKKKEKEFQEAADMNQRHIVMAESYTSYASKVQRGATDADLLQCFKSLQTRAEELRELPTTTEYMPINIEFRAKEDRMGEIRTVDQLKGLDTLQPYRQHSPEDVRSHMIPIQPGFCASFCDMFCFFTSPNPSWPGGPFHASPNNLTILIPHNQRGNLPGSHLLITPVVSIGQQSVCQLNISSFQNAASEIKSAQICIPTTSVRLKNYSESDAVTINYNYKINQNHSGYQPAFHTGYQAYVCQITLKVDVTTSIGSVKIHVTDMQIEHNQSNFKAVLDSVNLNLGVTTVITAIPVAVFNRRMDYIMASSTIYLNAQEPIDLAAAEGCPYTDSVYLLDRKNCAVHKLDKSLKQTGQWKIDSTPEHISITHSRTLLIACKTEAKHKIIELDITDGSPLREVYLQTLLTTMAKNNSVPNAPISTGTLMKIFPCQVASLAALIAQANGTNEISITNEDGQIVQQNITTGLQPLDVQVDRNGCILVLANDSKIYVFGGKNYEKKLELIDLSKHQFTSSNFMHLDSDFQRLLVGYKSANTAVKMFQLKINELRRTK